MTGSRPQIDLSPYTTDTDEKRVPRGQPVITSRAPSSLYFCARCDREMRERLIPAATDDTAGVDPKKYPDGIWALECPTCSVIGQLTIPFSINRFAVSESA